MPETDQLIVQCPACGGRLRTSRGNIGNKVGCPTCQAAVTVVDPSATGPVPMIVDPRRKLGVAPRGHDAAPDEDGFKDRLRRTSEPTFIVDPDNPVMVRRNLRKKKLEAALTQWDQSTQRRHHRRSRRSRRIMTGLVVASGLVILFLGRIFWQRLHRSAPPGGTSPPSSPVARPLELQAAGDFQDQVWLTVQKFCTASNSAALLPLIREPGRVAPLIKQFYNSDNPWIPFALARRPDLAHLEVHRNFVVFPLPLADFSTRPIALEQTPEGFRVDWESFVGYSELSWADLRRTRPRRPVLLRAVVKPTDYFNLDFPPGSPHRCYQLTDFHSDHVLWGYVPLGGDIELQIQKILLTAPTVHAVLRVRYPETSTNDRQLEITEVLEKGWIFREDDNPELPRQEPAPGLTKPPAQTTPGTGPTSPAILPDLTKP